MGKLIELPVYLDVMVPAELIDRVRAWCGGDRRRAEQFIVDAIREALGDAAADPDGAER